MATHIELRRDTAANWTTANPLLSLGEPAIETDTGRRKLGDGVTAWASLPYDGDRLAADPALRAALVPRPTGGSDGQALVKSGSNVVWGTVAGGGGISVTDNSDGTASTTSSSVADNGDGTATAA